MQNIMDGEWGTIESQNLKGNRYEQVLRFLFFIPNKRTNK